MSREEASAGSSESAGPEARGWFMYVLECEGGSLYTGIAVDVEKRFRVHQSGKGARYTRAFPPLRILVRIAYPDRASASRAEYAFKQKTAQEKRLYCEAHACGATKTAE
jgi:putative endonuclease